MPGLRFSVRSPGFIDVRMVPGFGPHAPRSAVLDLERFEATKAAFADRLMAEARQFCEVEDLAAFRARDNNPLRLTPPRKIMLRNPAEDIHAAFDTLVAAPRARNGRR